MKTNVWSNFLKPVVVLVTICVLTSGLLAVTNNITAPIIEENTLRMANEARRGLLPQADDFEAFSTEIAGITEAFRAKNGVGYVLTAYAKGYAGNVPVMVAFDAQGGMLGINCLANEETPGLGQKVRTEKFMAQFAGRDAENFGVSDIDAVSGATISSAAVVTAMNAAIDAYKAEMGTLVAPLTPEELRASLLPDAGAITPLEALPEGVKEGYKGEVYGVILYVETPGFYKKPLTAAVAFDDEGTMTGAWFDASNETEGYGVQVGTDKDFAQQFQGKTGASDADVVAGATESSKIAMKAVNIAVAAYHSMKGA